MKVYGLICPGNRSDPASFNRLQRNLGALCTRRLANGVELILSDENEDTLSKHVFDGVSPSAEAIMFLIADTVTCPKDLLE